MPTDPRPLYRRVYIDLLTRISSRPSEDKLRRELGVAPGTLRRALELLEREGLIERKQGYGSFVVETTPAHVQFRFFSIYADDDEKVLPESIRARARLAVASRLEQRQLKLDDGAKVVRIGRVRTREGVPFITETIALPAALVPGLESAAEIPNALYDLLQASYGITIARADERLRAVPAGKTDAGLLGIEIGTPLLRIERIAFCLGGRPVEWRLSNCLLVGAHYRAQLGWSGE
jgi:GntR family transcriptional regulator